MLNQRKGARQSRRSALVVLALLVSFWAAEGFFLAPPALSDPAGDKTDRAAKQIGPKKGKEDRTVQRNLRMEEIEIYGDVEKPKTMFVIPRSSLRYSRKEHEKDFTGEILDPITKQWVEDTQRWRQAVPPP